jgi:hypothetical protein
MQVMAARAALADRVEPVIFIVITIVTAAMLFLLRHGAEPLAGMLLVIPDQVALVVLLEIPEPHRHFQILIISPEARAEPVALGVLLEAMAGTCKTKDPVLTNGAYRVLLFVNKPATIFCRKAGP